MGVPKGGVAFFDSGIGGLTVMAECRKLLPNEQFYYFGDNTHAPYGNLPDHIIRKYTLKAFKRFKKLQVKAAVIACNTATAVCVEKLRKKYAFPIIGAEPALKLAAKETEGTIYALMTKATCESVRIVSLLENCKNIYPKANVRLCPCAQLAGEIENHIADKEYVYDSFLPKGKPIAVVLGCTHYIYIKEAIQKFYGCRCYDGNHGIAERLSKKIQNKQENELKNVQNWDRRPTNRDERPPMKKTRRILRFCMSKFVVLSKPKKKNNANKRSLFLRKAFKEKVESKRDSSIFFIGKSKKYNREIYEQMFVF